MAAECGYKNAKTAKDLWAQVKKAKLNMTPGTATAKSPKKRTAEDDNDEEPKTPSKTPKKRGKPKKEAKEEDAVKAEDDLEVMETIEPKVEGD